MALQHVDEPRLETDLAYRFQYLTEFMGFTPDDVAVIHAAAPLLAPLVPSLVDAVYAKALELGGSDEGAPGERFPGFYAAYFRDLDGNKLNCCCMGS